MTVKTLSNVKTADTAPLSMRPLSRWRKRKNGRKKAGGKNGRVEWRKKSDGRERRGKERGRKEKLLIALMCSGGAGDSLPATINEFKTPQ